MCIHYKALYYIEGGEAKTAHCGRCVDPKAKRLGRVRAETKKACERFEQAEESANG